MKHFIKLIISIAIPLTVGAISGMLTSNAVKGWFITINKPSFNPPNWVFAPVWTLLYILMGIAFFIIWKSAVNADVKRTAIIFYSIQLVLNFLWSLFFFGLHQPGWALADIILLWIMILFTIFSFGKISNISAWLLVPYICWVSFATLLNYSFWKLN